MVQPLFKRMCQKEVGGRTADWELGYYFLNMRLLFAALLLLISSYAADNDAKPSSRPVRKQPPITVLEAAVDLYSAMGRTVRWDGTVKGILKSGLPTELLMETDGVLWVAQYWNSKPLKKAHPAPGHALCVKGSVTQSAKVFWQGSEQTLMFVMADGATERCAPPVPPIAPVKP